MKKKNLERIYTGDLEVSIYKNGKLVEKRIDKDRILNANHWKIWAKFDRGQGASATARKNFDYQAEKQLLTSYTTKLGNDKRVYKRIFSKPAKRTNEFKEY